MWQFIRDGRREIVRVAGIKRTLIVYDSLVRLLTPTSNEAAPAINRGRDPTRSTASAPNAAARTKRNIHAP
jgi:hypothetical protein